MQASVYINLIGGEDPLLAKLGKNIMIFQAFNYSLHRGWDLPSLKLKAAPDDLYVG